MAHYNLRLVNAGQGLLEDIAEYKKAIALDPDDVDAHYYLGDDYRIQGRLKDAIAEFKEVLRLNPQRADVQKRLKHLENR